jgi:AcrR family transcriptional regulator
MRRSSASPSGWWTRSASGISSRQASPGTRRPGGRTARNRAAVFTATIALLTELGYAELDVEAIAARAGVHKTTIYRRWGSKDRVVVEAFMAEAEQRIELRDTGDIDRDARALAYSVVAILASQVGAAAIQVMIAATPMEERQRIAHQFWASRLLHVRPMVERAVARGQLPGGTDAWQFMMAVAAPLFFRVLVAAEPLTSATADLAAAAALVAARAGLLANGER